MQTKLAVRLGTLLLTTSLTQVSGASVLISGEWLDFDVRAFAGPAAAGPIQTSAVTSATLSQSDTESDQFATTTASGTVSGSQSSSDASTLSTALNIQASGTASSGRSGGVIYGATQNVRIQVVGQPETMTFQVLNLIQTLTNTSAAISGQSATFSSVETLGSGSGGTFSFDLTGPDVFTTLLQPGTYNLTINLGGQIERNTEGPWSGSALLQSTLDFTNASFLPGASLTNPLLPDGTTPNGGFIFSNLGCTDPGSRIQCQAAIDPVLADGYDFETSEGALFTEILGLPTNFSSPFEILADGASLGFFGGGTSVDFLNILGHGVSNFSIRGIVPNVDSSNPLAFPIDLAFDRPTTITMTPVASVTVQPIDEPAIPALLLAAFTAFISQLPRWSARANQNRNPPGLTKIGTRQG